MMFCPSCGTQNVDGAQFCSGCGTPLENTAPSQPKGVYKQVTHNISQLTARPALNNTLGSFDNLIGIAAGFLFLVLLVFEFKSLMVYTSAYIRIGSISSLEMPNFIRILLRTVSYLLMMIYAFGFYNKRKCTALFGVGHILSVVAVIIWVFWVLSYILVYFENATFTAMVILGTLITVAYHICIMVFTFAKVRNTNTVKTFCVTFLIITIVLKAVFQIIIWMAPEISRLTYIELSDFLVAEGLMAATLLLAPKTAEKV